MTFEEIIERLDKMAQHHEICGKTFAPDFSREKYQAWGQVLREAVAKLHTHPDAQPNEPLGDGWISVKDRLPDTGVPVLIHNPHWDYGVVANYAGKGVWMDTWRQRMTYTPTHWRPLPEPPKEEKKV